MSISQHDGGREPHDDPQGFLQAVVADWEASEQIPSTQQVVADHPALRHNRSLFVKLAYEEFRLRRKRGEELAADSFCDQFASCHYAVRRMLSVHLAMVEHPSWLAEFSADLPEAEDVWPVPGQEFLRFRILREIGRGGLARVYLAQEHDIGNRLVVLKVSPRDTGEARIMGRLQHPGIMPIHQVDFDEASGLHLVVMPFLGTTTLFDVLDEAFPQREGTFPQTADFMRRLAEAGCDGRETAHLAGHSIFCGEAGGSYLDAVVELGQQLAEALAYTHGKGVLHRDLKPSNILITPQGLPLLMDFNLSARTDGPGLLAGGTVPYMPPELLSALSGSTAFRVSTSDTPFASTWNTVSQEDCVTNDLRGDSTNREYGGWVACADPRSDLFSWGVIVYELLTGQLPYGEPDVRQPVNWQAEWLLKRQHDRPVERHAGNEHIPEGLFELLQRCLSVDPAQRPSGAGELMRDLSAWRTAVAEPAASRAVAGSPATVVSSAVAHVEDPNADVAAAAVPAVATNRPASWLGDRTRLKYRTMVATAVTTCVVLLAVAQAGRRPVAAHNISYPESAAADASAGSVPDVDDVSDPGQVLMQEAQRLMSNAQWNDALSALQDALKHGVDPGENLSLQAYCAAQDNKYATAIGKSRAAVQNSYRSASVLNNQGYAQVRLKLYKEARLALEAAVELAPREPAIHHNLADLEYHERDIERAVHHIRQALDNTLEPSVPLHWLAATILAAASEPGSELEAEAAKHLEASLLAGLNPDVLTATSPELARVVKIVQAKNVRPLWPNATPQPNDRILWPTSPAAEQVAATTGG